MSKKNGNRKLDPNLSLVEIKPITEAQVRVFSSKKNLVLHGAAGTGKSFISSYLAYKDVLDRVYGRLIYVRSAVPTRDIGFLPGTEKEKTDIYKRPYIDIAKELFDRGDAYELLEASNVVNFMTTSFVRGLSLDHAVIIVDECQNMTYQELDSIITRVGDNSRIIFCGDYYQKDLKNTGIKDFYEVLHSMSQFDFVNFTIEDVVRSDLVKSYLKAKYEKGNFEQSDLSNSKSRITGLIAANAKLSDS